MTRHQNGVVLEATTFWEFAPLLMRAQSRYTERTGRCLGTGVCVAWSAPYLESKLHGMTSQCGGIGLISCKTYRSVRYRVGAVPTLPKCPVNSLFVLTEGLRS